MFDVFISNFHIIGTLFFMVLGWRRVLRGGKSESAIGNWVRPGERPPNAEAMSRKSSTPFSSSSSLRANPLLLDLIIFILFLSSSLRARLVTDRQNPERKTRI